LPAPAGKTAFFNLVSGLLPRPFEGENITRQTIAPFPGSAATSRAVDAVPQSHFDPGISNPLRIDLRLLVGLNITTSSAHGERERSGTGPGSRVRLCARAAAHASSQPRTVRWASGRRARAAKAWAAA
jgi:hypothetical protein